MHSFSKIKILTFVTNRATGPRYVPPAFRQQMTPRQTLATIPSQQAVPTVQQTKLKIEPGTDQGVTVEVETETKPGIKDPAIAHGDNHSNSGNSADDRD